MIEKYSNLNTNKLIKMKVKQLLGLLVAVLYPKLKLSEQYSQISSYLERSAFLR